MISTTQAGTEPGRTPRFVAPFPSVADLSGPLHDPVGRHGDLRITVYECGSDEAELFREMAPRFGVTPVIILAPLSEATVQAASGSRCVSVGHKTRITSSALLGLHDVGVRYLSTRSVGYNHIDLRSARQLGIAVENVAYSPDSVADFTLMLILMAVRNAKSTLSRVQARDYRLDESRGRELRDLTIGVVGTGRIGAAVIDRVRGFGCRVLAHDRCPKIAVDYVSLEELLRLSDVVTLHTPLHADTHHLLNSERIEQMKPDAFIINTGRGELVDTGTLLAALESHQLGGAALDVVEGEEGIFYCDCRRDPVGDSLLSRLQRMPNVLITPHTAYYTDHALTDIVENTLVNCLGFEAGEAWIA